MYGMEVKVLAKVNRKKYPEYRWIQDVMTDDPISASAPKDQWYKDPFDGPGPYLYPDPGNEQDRRAEGRAHNGESMYYDWARRPNNNYYFKARATLVGVKAIGGTNFDKLATFEYGFRVTNGKVVPDELSGTSKP
jgi:hypothetical protein